MEYGGGRVRGSVVVPGVGRAGPDSHLDAIQGHAARTAGDSYWDVTVKAMAMAMEKVPRVEGEM